MAQKGNLEAVSEALGEALNEMTGFRQTRLTAAAALAATSITVEGTLGWPVPGVFMLGGVTHRYTGGTATTFTGITHEEGGTVITGLAAAARVGDVVTDYSRTFSFLEKIRRQLMVRTATGDYLSVIGRRLGVLRNRVTDDELFRLIVQVLAYLPRGTIYGLELALTAFFGAGNFKITEDFPDHRNTVFIELPATLATNPRGHAYMLTRERHLLGGANNQVTIGRTPQWVQSVRLADENRCDVYEADLPSALNDDELFGPYQAWFFFGNSEAEVSVDAEGVLFSTAGGHTAGYYRTIRCRPTSRARFGILMRTVGTFSTSASAALQAAFNLRNGARDVGVGMVRSGTDLLVGFLDSGSPGQLLRTAATIPLAVQHHLEIRQVPNLRTGVVMAELWVDGVWKDSEPTTSFPTTVLNEVRFGSQDSAHVPSWRVKATNSWAQTDTDFWNSDIQVDTVLGTNHAFLAAGNVGTGDIGRSVYSRPSNPLGDRGRWKLTAYDAGSFEMVVEGRTHRAAKVNPLTGARVTLSTPQVLTYPDDGAQRLILSGSVASPPNNLSSLIANLMNAAAPTTALSDGLEARTNVLEVASPPGGGFVAEDGLTWRLDPVFNGDAGVSMVLVGTGTVLANLLTTREAVPLNIPAFYPVLMEVTYATMRSAHLVQDETYANDPVDTLFPFYLPQAALGRFTAFLKDLTAAGVIPEVVNL